MQMSETLGDKIIQLVQDSAHRAADSGMNCSLMDAYSGNGIRVGELGTPKADAAARRLGVWKTVRDRLVLIDLHQLSLEDPDDVLDLDTYMVSSDTVITIKALDLDGQASHMAEDLLDEDDAYILRECIEGASIAPLQDVDMVSMAYRIVVRAALDAAQISVEALTAAPEQQDEW